MKGKANQKRRLLYVLFLLGVFGGAAQGRIIYVDDDAAGANDGSSWANAFNYLQDALITASAGDEIRVAGGTYRPNQGLLLLPGRVPRTPDKIGRSANFGLKPGLILKGGFAGFDELDPNERDPETYKTILTGDLDGNDVDANHPCDLMDEPTRTENSYNVVTIYRDDPNIVLDGLIVTSATKGGLVNIGGSPRISNCVFVKNSNDDSGGAVVSINGSTVLTCCRFVKNSAAQHGGAIYSDTGNDVLVECSFVENSALDGTGIVNIEGNLELESCTFSHNSTYSSSSTNEEGGGAIFIVSQKVVVKDCLFSENVARYGGAMVGVADVLKLERCVFTGNSAEYGGAIYDLRGGTVTNCIFAGNRADEGGAVCGRGIGPRLIGCTLFGNTGQNGNAISWYPFLDGPPFTMNVTNCILWNGGGEIGRRNGRLPDITITYSDIQGGWPGEGNIDADPLFADPENRDFHLKSQAGRWQSNSERWVQDDVTSPCIDAGDPNSGVAFEPFPSGGIINMGAYGGTAEASKSPSGLQAQYGGGTGEPNDPYLIYTAEQMNEIGLHEEDQHKHFKLMADIDLYAYSGTAFNMIGVTDRAFPGFAGVFDGDGHTISNFTYTSTHSDSVGIFTSIWGLNACISNLGLIDPKIDAEAGTSVGPLVGRLETGTIANCYVVGGKISGGRHVGGLIGYNDGHVANCLSYCTIHAEEMVGGLVGRNDGIVMTSCSYADITGISGIGGLVGHNANQAEIANCYTRGEVVGQQYIGGLVGINAGGGRLGGHGIIHNCYSTTTVTGNEQIGGLIGLNGDDENADSLWDIETSGQTTSQGGTGKTTAEMQDPNTFIDAGWDFVGESANGTEDIWWIIEGRDYPRLWWEMTEGGE